MSVSGGRTDSQPPPPPFQPRLLPACLLLNARNKGEVTTADGRTDRVEPRRRRRLPGRTPEATQEYDVAPTSQRGRIPILASRARD